jgi:hypothetical protein
MQKEAAMARKFISFQEVEALADILQIARMLGLDTRPSGSQFRCGCPVHGGDHRQLCISPQINSRGGSQGVFYCQRDKSGGDRIGLAAHVMEMGQQDAAFFIAQQFGMEIANSSTVTSDTVTVPTVSKTQATAPQARQKASTSRETTRQTKPEQPFDPEAFAAKLAYADEVAALGFSEEDAEHFQVGSHRGKVYAPLRHPDGSIACFYDYGNGTLKLPARSRWLEQSAPNVIPFGKKTA